MNWALRRQIFYLGILALFFATIAFIILYPSLNKPPTCMDGKQNGDEAGVDCGGSCLLACVSQVEDISILWTRSFEVISGRYNAVAYLSNHNDNKVVERINYRFRFADKDNIYIGSREGTTFVPPSGNFAIFEGPIDMGESTPVYSSFEFTSMPVWIQVSPEKVSQLKVLVSNIALENVDTAPHLAASVRNNSLFSIPNLNFVTILYDASHNAITASRTYLEELTGEETREINFTWPVPFTVPIVQTEIIPIYNIGAVEWK